MPLRSRNAVIAGGVVLFHAAALWALQSGLVRRVVEVIVPVSVLTEVPPEPKVEAAPTPPAPAPSPRPPEPVRKPPAPAPAPRPTPRVPSPPPPPQPLAVPQAAPTAPLGTSTPEPPAPPAPAVAAPAPPAPAAAPAAPAAGTGKVELPSSDADYLQNPKPPYPPLSRRLGEQGRVVVRVLIGADGLPQRAELAESSGFERLDQAALATVMKWRYVPGKRGGVPETMWFRVPINFVLE